MSTNNSTNQRGNEDTKSLNRDEAIECELLNQWIEQNSDQVDSNLATVSLQNIALELRHIAKYRVNETSWSASVDAQGDSTAIPQIEGYEIIGLIGRGGMGSVYGARDLRLQRVVAIKALCNSSLNSAKAQKRFLVEVQAAAQLEHENIVSVYEYGTYPGGLYYSMRLIDGADLAEKIAQDSSASTPDSTTQNAGGPPVNPGDAGYRRWAADLIRKAANALHHSHEQLVIHRDIKPANILVDRHGTPYLTDFGLARINDGTDLTDGGDLIGTIRYMSPEQLSGSQAVGPQTDVYSLGLTLYEMITGLPAISTEVFNHAVKQITDGRISPPRILNPRIEVDLETIVLKAISLETHSRYSSASDFADDLERFLAIRPIHARRPSLTLRLNRWFRRNLAWASALIGLSVLTLALAVGFAFLEAQRAARDSRTIRQYAAESSDLKGVMQLRNSQGLQAIASFQKSADLAPEKGISRKQLQRISAIKQWSPRTVHQRVFKGKLLTRLSEERRIESRVNGDKVEAVMVQGDGDEKTLFSTRGTINFIRRNPDGQLIAFVIGDSTNRDFEIKVYDVNKEQLWAFSPEPWRVTHVWFSNDSKSLFATGWGGDIFQYSLEASDKTPTRRVHYPKTSPYTWVYSATTDLDNSVLVSALNPGQLVAYKSPSLEPLWDIPMKLEDWRVDLLEISPDSSWVVAGTEQDKARLWHIETRQELSLVNNVKGKPTAAAFSPNGKMLAIGDSQGGVYFWRLPEITAPKAVQLLKSKEPEEQLMPQKIHREGVVMWHAAAIRDLHLNASNELLVTSGSQAHTWRLSDQQRLAGIISVDDQISSAQWISSSRIRLTTRKDSFDTESIWELPSYYSRRFSVQGSVKEIAYNSGGDSTCSVTGGSGGEEETNRRIRHEQPQTTEIVIPEHLKEGSWTVSGNGERIAVLMQSKDTSDKTSISTIKVVEPFSRVPEVGDIHQDTLLGNLRLNFDGTKWLANDGVSGLRVGTIGDERHEFELKLPNWFVDAEFLKNDYIAAISWDQTLRIWDERGNAVCQFKLAERPTNLVFQSNTIVVAAGHRAYLYRCKTPRNDSDGNALQDWKAITMCSHEGSLLQHVSIAPNGKAWLTCDANGLSRLWSDTGEQIGEFTENAPAVDCKFSPDGLWLAMLSEKGHIQIYDGISGKVMGPAIHAKNPIHKICWTRESLMFSGGNTDQAWLAELKLPKDWLEN